MFFSCVKKTNPFSDTKHSVTVELLYASLLKYAEPTGEGTTESVFREISLWESSLPADAHFEIKQLNIFFYLSCFLSAPNDRLPL